jgi:hypothetical protein
MKNKLLEKVLNNFASEVISNAKKNLVDDRKSRGDLYKTLKYEVTVSKDLFLIDFLMEPYGVFVDKGVKGKTSTYPETQTALSKFQYGSGTGPKGGLTKGIKNWLNKKKFQCPARPQWPCANGRRTRTTCTGETGGAMPPRTTCRTPFPPRKVPSTCIPRHESLPPRRVARTVGAPEGNPPTALPCIDHHSIPNIIYYNSNNNSNREDGSNNCNTTSPPRTFKPSMEERSNPKTRFLP